MRFEIEKNINKNIVINNKAVLETDNQKEETGPNSSIIAVKQNTGLYNQAPK